MAGLGFKDFQVGEVLTSSDVDGYLMQQSVMRFADSGARGSALGTAPGTAVALAEGMVSYLDDADAIEVFNGSIWRNIGVVAQVVGTAKTDTFSTTSTSFVDITNLSVSITPASSASRMLLIAQLNVGHGGTQGAVVVQFSGGNAGNYIGDASGSRSRAGGGYFNPLTVDTGATYYTKAAMMTYIDSPATTSAITYKVQMRRDTNGTAYLNRSHEDSNSSDRLRVPSSLTVIEVAA